MYTPVNSSFTILYNIKWGSRVYITSKARGATYDDFRGQFFRIFEIIISCFVVAICDLVHDVETIFHLSYVLTASGNLF